MTTITLKAGRKLTEEEIARANLEYKKARKHKPIFDKDCPKSTPQALAEFAAMARERQLSGRPVQQTAASS